MVFEADDIVATLQLEDVLSFLKIDSSLSVQEKIDRLRDVPSSNLIAKFSSVRLDTFSPVTDENFVSSSMLKLLRDGTVARLFKDRGMRIMVGEMESEVCQVSLAT